MAAILNSAILNWTILDSAILVFPFKLTHTCQDWFHPFAQKTLHSFSLTQLDDGSHLKLCHVGFIHFAKKKTSIFHSQSTWWWQPSWILPFWLQPFCQKKISFIHFDSTWWWQPSWIPLSWIWPWWIQPFCTKLWLKLIQSDSNCFIFT